MLLAAALLFVATAEPRDPFSSIATVDPLVVTDPMQRVPVDAIKLAGVVDDASPRALVSLPDGSSHVLRVGDVVGDHFGVVKSIAHGRVVVVERFWTFAGTQTSTHTLSLH